MKKSFLLIPAGIIGLAFLAVVASANMSTAADDAAIRSFTSRFWVGDLTNLRKRITATRLPERELVKDNTQGVQLETMKALLKYWRTEYNWAKLETRLNIYPQFITKIDGVDIHFIHVRSRHPNAMPLILTHGWPGSFIEFLKVIGPLTDPTAHGGRAEDAFDVIVPSIPGYGFSGKPTTVGWDPVHIAKAWIVLMKRLGYTRYVAQGGDWGDAITEQMALQEPAGLLGIHTNMPATVPAEIMKAINSGMAAPSELSADERMAFDRLEFFTNKGLAYALEMKTRPQTLYGIVDSPAGLAGWMIDHDIRSYDLIARAFAGKTEGLSREDILDNISLYWLTNTAISSARLYWENTFNFLEVKHVKIPVAVSVFPDEIYAAPKTWAETAYPKLIYFHKVEKGGHFAAWEQPEIFVNELRDGFRTLR